MNTDILLALTGILAGLTHVLTGPDHMASIAPLTVDKPVSGWKIGLWWGIGHSGSVWIIAVLVFFLKEMIPIEGMSLWGERGIAIVLIAVGLWGIKKAVGTKVHSHEHEHEGIKHTHYHIHNKKIPHDHPEAHQHTHASLSIGMLHGMAGTSHYLALLPALALPGASEAVAYIVGFGIGTIAGMAGFSWLIGTFAQKYLKGSQRGISWMQGGFSGFAICTGIAMLILI